MSMLWWKPLTLGTLVERDVCVPETDGDSSLQLLGVTVGPLAGKGLCEGGLPVVDVTDHPDVDLGLLWDFHQFSAASPSAGLRHSSMDLGPYSATAMLIWTISAETVDPRMAVLFL